MKVIILTLVLLLAGCAQSPVLKHCEPVPEFLTKVPEKPSASLSEASTTRDQMNVIADLDEWADTNNRRLRSVEAHQAPCREGM